MLKKLVFFLFLILFQSFYSQISENTILGKWMTVDKSVMVEIYRKGKDFQAKVLWFDDRLGSGKPMNSRHDTSNPNPALRTRKIIGMDVLSGFVFNQKEKRWEHGKIYDAYSGRTWDSSAQILQDGKLKVRGFWKFEFIGKSLFFYRVK